MPAILAETSSMVSAPRFRRACPDGATTEKDTAWRFVRERESRGVNPKRQLRGERRGRP